MDEREVQGLLRSAAETVQPSADLSARAEQRYQRRRVRGRVLAAAVVVVLVSSGVAIASSISTNHRPNEVGPVTTTTSPTPNPNLGPVHVSNIGSMTFIDANNGFGVEAGRYLVHSTDGGRTWRRQGLMPLGDHFVLLAPEYAKSLDNLVAWGNGRLAQSSDGGAHWRATLEYSVTSVGEASFRLWAAIACGVGHISGGCPPPIETSTDGGRTWSASPTPSDVKGGLASITTPAGSSVYLVDRAFAVTHDYGRTWAHHPAPAACGPGPLPSLAVNAGVLLLVCAPRSLSVGWRSLGFVSVDEGRTWQPTAPLPRANSVYGPTASATDAGFVVPPNTGPLLVTADNGKSWHDAFPMPHGSAIRGIGREFGVGVWVAAGNAGIWFSADGVHWVRRTRSLHG